MLLAGTPGSAASRPAAPPVVSAPLHGVSLHLLPHREAHHAQLIIAPVVVRQHVSRARTVRCRARVVLLAFCDVLPQMLRRSAVRRYAARVRVLNLALVRVAK